LAAVVRQQKN